MNNPKMINVKSSMMKQIGYDPSNQELVIIYNNDERHIYPNISPELFEKFVNSESKGKFFHKFIKQGGSNENREKDYSKSNKQGLSFLEMNDDESVSTMVKTYDFRAKNGRLLFTIYATLLSWVAGAEIEGEIMEYDDFKLISIDFSFPTEKMFDYLPESKDILEKFIADFSTKTGHPLGKLLGLDLKSLAIQLNEQIGFEILYLPEWLLTDSTDQGIVDIEKVRQFDKEGNERNLMGFAKAYQKHFHGRRSEADGEVIEWCDLMVYEGGYE